MIKKIPFLLVLISINAYSSEYQVRIPFEGTYKETPTIPTPEEKWLEVEPVVIDWSNKNAPYDCNWAPNVSTYSIGVKFQQTASDCIQEQIKTTQRYEQSTLTHEKRELGNPIEESRLIGNTSGAQEAIGTRYTHSLTVGYYTYGSNGIYYGDFSDQYMNDFGQGITTVVKGGLSPNTYAGYTINHLVLQVTNTNPSGITMRLLPIHSNSGLKPKLTIDGVTCDLVGPSIYSAYDAVCNVNLSTKVGQTIHIDLQ